MELDTATYCKIERDERRAKRKQLVTLSRILNIDEATLAVRWLVNQIMTVIENDKPLAVKALEITKQNI